jgi:hypothetical protein
MQIKHLLLIALAFMLAACGSDEQASRIVLGTGNQISVLNELQYQKSFSVQVSDNDGNPAGGTAVTVRLRNLNYYKGYYVVSGDSWVAVYSTICDAEDINNNGVLQAGEDINGNGRLDPTNAATISAHPSETPTFTPGTGTIVTDENGFGYFSITYPKSEALWVKVRLTASADVAGTESSEIYESTLAVLVTDLSSTSVTPPGGVESKYGVAVDCSNAN